MTRLKRILFVASALALWCALPQTGWSWGRDGHFIVGQIAELHLTDKAHAAIADLTDVSIADPKISSWADTITQHPSPAFNSFWHFVDIPFDADDFDAQREAEAIAQRVNKSVKEIGTKNNVIDQIEISKKT